jgi:hypothetical protein
MKKYEPLAVELESLFLNINEYDTFDEKEIEIYITRIYELVPTDNKELIDKWLYTKEFDSNATSEFFRIISDASTSYKLATAGPNNRWRIFKKNEHVALKTSSEKYRLIKQKQREIERQKIAREVMVKYDQFLQLSIKKTEDELRNLQPKDLFV